MQQFMFSFSGFSVPEPMLEGVRRGEISSFCLFRRKNFESVQQLRNLTLSLHQAAEAGGHPPPMIGIDQEGGQLMAMTTGTTGLPGNMALGATRSTELAHSAGGVLAR